MFHTYVASVLSGCCVCLQCFSSVFASVSSIFRRMLQVLHLDVSKVDRDVAHDAMVVRVCCKRLFQMFRLFFQTYVASVFI